MSTSVCIIANRRIITEISDKQQQFLSIFVLATPKFHHEPQHFPSFSNLSLTSTPIFLSHKHNLPMPVAARSKTWVCVLSLTGTGGSNYVEGISSVSFKRCVFSSRGLCDEPIPRLEESYLLCVCVRVRACVRARVPLGVIRSNINPPHLQ